MNTEVTIIMVKHIILVVAAVAAACGLAAAQRGPTQKAGLQLAKAVDKFGFNFLQEAVKKAPSENLVTSPLSASSVFALLSLGAGGKTHDEIIDVLKLQDDHTTRTEFGKTTSALAVTRGVTLALANRLFMANNGFTLAPAFKNDATEVFDAGVESINFGQGEQAAKTINQYVQNATHDRIKDLISDTDLNSDTRLVLVNAIYFKGKWQTRFEARKTKERDFKMSPGRNVQVPTMTSLSEYEYAESENLGVQIVELPYEEGAVSLVVVLPRPKNSLDELLKLLATPAGAAEIIATVQRLLPTQVNLHLPRFKVETEVDLKDVFTKLGASKMFDPQLADLSKLATGKEQLYVYKAVQKAFIEVNEDGAEAAAASAAMIYGRSGRVFEPPQPVRFYANRPFLWLLRTRTTHLTLFSGIYRGP